ncbi:MAG: ATP-binding protein [Thermoplasmata archaeon]|nr:ATP-binding protein [Thermoplasmata archaeon]
MIIERPRETELLRKGRWTFVYGRRKTGKTFLVENFTEYDDFFFVKRDRTILLKEEWEDLDYRAFLRILRNDLDSGKRVVVDEFHRLGDDFLDHIHSLPKKGGLVLISSTLHTAKTLMDRNSPLLGKFVEMPVSLISLGDTLLALKGSVRDKKRLMETAVMMREPITADLTDTDTPEMPSRFALTIPALVGEVFSEEERKITKTYEGIIRATASGKNTSGQISSFLHSRRLMPKDDPSVIQQYLNNLVRFGILTKTPVWNKNRMLYLHRSPLTHLYYYLDEKYNIGERTVDRRQMEDYTAEVMPKIVEASVREFIGELFGMTVHVHQNPDFEADGILGTFKRPEIALEVKWKDSIRGEDIRKAEENLSRINAPRNILVVPDNTGLRSSSLEILDVEGLAEMYEHKLEPPDESQGT